MNIVRFTSSLRWSGSQNAVSRQQGIALIMVLWLIVLLGSVAVGHIGNVHSEIRLATLYVQSAKARALAEAGIQHAIFSLLQPNNANPWPMNGTVQRIVFDGREVKVAIRDATGLVDLNRANAKLLENLFSSTIHDAQQRVKLVNALLDWRDPDDFPHLHGAEGDDYRSAGFAWTPHNAAFSSIEELHYLIGMTPSIFSEIAPYVTVYSGQAALNFEYAPQRLITILTGKTMDSAPISANRLSPDNRSQGRRISRDGTYHIYAGTTGSGDVFVSVEAAVSISTSADRPYTVLNWHIPARFNFLPGV